MAGDNNLESFGVIDLNEMKASGSTDTVALVAQYDRMSDQVTRRYYLTNYRDLQADCVTELPEVNTGDPAALLDFVTWATTTYPAEKYALVLWNHGAGWKDDDIYHIAAENGISEKVTRGQVRSLTHGKLSRSLFRPTMEKTIVEAIGQERAILFDDSSADFLDNIEMRNVLIEIVQRLGRPLDLLGFDACLMSMLEIHYQVRDLCHVVVGSQETEPGDGWPYDFVTKRLVENPDMNSTLLSQGIVADYVDFYRTAFPHLPVTQSAVSTKKLHELASAVSALGQACQAAVSDYRSVGILFGALRAAESFTDPDYIDLMHFCQLLNETDPTSAVGKTADRVCKLLSNPDSPILASAHNGPGVENASGISIYLTTRLISPLYAGLLFAADCAWDEFLLAFTKPRS